MYKNAEVNNKFDDIAEKMGVKGHPNDSDSIVKPTIQTMIFISVIIIKLLSLFIISSPL